MEYKSKTPYIGRAKQGVLVDQNRVFSKRLTMRLLQRRYGLIPLVLRMSPNRSHYFGELTNSYTNRRVSLCRLQSLPYVAIRACAISRRQ